MNGNEWSTYLYELQYCIMQQDEKIKLLEKRVDTLEKKATENKAPNIEKIEYKFDQLKIEHLAGTLHIGLSPSDLENIEELASQQTTPPNYPVPLKQQLTSELQQYLRETGPSQISNLAATYHKPIDESFQAMLLQDINNQLPSRISFYEQEALKQNHSRNHDQLHTFITDSIKNEINQSLQNYMQSSEKEGEDS
ncbi:spore germination protein GerPC [Oceanobacillus chungangensis]|uniref:Uncharacterized protein n=1 Tax=Oceanobacillus chungangensis TaxID=1229152 RepID=A0A3D8PXC6_9BACI|nr:spore germination protein GerPC [Oceanobacillus chungangensis]RDW19928.1 hypothetical protein CWR45_07660 [Oceanobacillus chungangensis]